MKRIPTLVIRPDYGRRLASGIPRSRYAPVAETSHFPQIEQLEEVERVIRAFVDGLDDNRRVDEAN